MSVHKLNTERSTAEIASLPLGLSIQHETHDLADAVMTTRALRALENGVARYPIHRSVQCAGRRPVEEVFDDLALKSGLAAFRFSEGTLLLDGPGVFIRANGWRKAGYASCQFQIWTESSSRLHELREMLFGIVGERLAPERMFTVDWHFTTGYGLTSTSSDELLHEELHDEAYPTVPAPLSAFIERYLNSHETVLVLQGPPGTGKTRLVRAILGAMSLRKGESAEVMYTADKKALEADEIFVRFITGSHDAFVLEDADHLLLARNNGNQDLHRFLAIADGVVRAQGRKIIFTTNLPNVSDMDEALLRPGRCFANVRTRLLTRDEAALLAKRVVVDEAKVEAMLAAAFTDGKGASVAEVYRACSSANAASVQAAN